MAGADAPAVSGGRGVAVLTVILLLIGLSVLLEPKGEFNLKNVVLEAVALMSVLFPMACLQYAGEFAAQYHIQFTDKIFVIPVVGAIAVIAIDFVSSWFSVLNLLVTKILQKKKKSDGG